jgi:hypothetical protein
MCAPRSSGIKPQSISSNIEKLVVILTSVGLISADAVAHHTYRSTAGGWGVSQRQRSRHRWRRRTHASVDEAHACWWCGEAMEGGGTKPPRGRVTPVLRKANSLPPPLCADVNTFCAAMAVSFFSARRPASTHQGARGVSRGPCREGMRSGRIHRIILSAPSLLVFMHTSFGSALR